MAVILPPKGRDLRLDLFRGVANWQVFINHIPNNIFNWLTTLYYGFSDAADLFVFISGFTASFVYARIMIDRGTVVGGARILRRTWQIFVAQVFLFCVYASGIGYLALEYHDPNLDNIYNIHLFFENPVHMLLGVLTLRYKPLNMDVLPLYVVLMLVFPVVLWAMIRKPNLVAIASILLYLAARHFDWNAPSYPSGTWYFNPFCWQLLFVLGAWFALGGAAVSMPIIRSRSLLIFGTAYLIFALIMTLAGWVPSLRAALPDWLYDAFNPNDKTNLAPYRVLHLAIIVLLVTRFLPRDWSGLHWRIFRPAILCGQQSLQTFCVGIFLSFVGYFVLIQVSDAIWMQILVNIVGLTILTLMAWYKVWITSMDKPTSRLPTEASPSTGSSSANPPHA
ncbi:OpgC domain-containing protein [Bradyrhizobium sp. SYSU BS000235]|uniref:OpgC domain-containing protein n=1 Tax=Bradyrhizobium sp. SYSU BS000235 TaxID=3411332 RepID=UPI003C76C77B